MDNRFNTQHKKNITSIEITTYKVINLKQKTKHKTLTGAGVGFLNFGILGAIAGAIVGNNNKSEDLREVERKANQYAARKALNYAKQTGAPQEDIAEFSYKSAKADVKLKETQRSNKTLKGSLYGFAAGVGLAVTGLAIGALVTNPVGAGISLGLLAASVPTTAVGTLTGFYQHKRTERKIEEKAEAIGQNARNNVLQTSPSSYYTERAKAYNIEPTAQQQRKTSHTQKLSEENPTRTTTLER